MITEENKDIRKAKRKGHVSLGSKNLRERSACPKCGSILVKKRNRTCDYVCEACKWEGKTIKKVMW